MLIAVLQLGSYEANYVVVSIVAFAYVIIDSKAVACSFTVIWYQIQGKTQNCKHITYTSCT